MTGFRIAFGGAEERYAVKPDIATLGKIVGGGLPCGVFGGRREIMQMLAPLGPVYQAGTLSGNPLAMAAGARHGRLPLRTPRGGLRAIESLSKALAEGVAAEAGASQAYPLTMNRVGAMWTWFFTDQPVTDFTGASTTDTVRFGRFHRAMLDAGVWLPPSQYEAACPGDSPHGRRCGADDCRGSRCVHRFINSQASDAENPPVSTTPRTSHTRAGSSNRRASGPCNGSARCA